MVSDGRGVRYFLWSQPGPGEHTVVNDYVYMLRHADGRVDVEHERHITGCLPSAMWIDVMQSEGLRPTMVELKHSEIDPGTHHVFVGVKT